MYCVGIPSVGIGGNVFWCHLQFWLHLISLTLTLPSVNYMLIVYLNNNYIHRVLYYYYQYF